MINEGYVIEQLEKLKAEISNSQIGQDVLVLILKNFKKEGYFVEFGACDGLHFSNTLILEKEFAWSGILAEPCKSFYPAIRYNRKCTIDNRAVFSESNKILEFTYFPDQLDISGVSESFIEDGKVNKKRNKTSREMYNVFSISLDELLKEHNAPRHIDYMSIDTEGSEFLILNNFNFNNYDIDIITVEHNYNSEMRDNLKSLLEKNNFTRILDSHSKWDDWYLSNKFLNGINYA